MALLTTRFTDETLQINRRYRENQNVACIYGSLLKLSDQLPYEKLFVLEMNNSQNKLVGIGVITKKFYPREKLYTDASYNMYTYKGKYHILPEELPEEMIMELEKLLFYGKSHLKRGGSVSRFPEKWAKPEYIKTLNEILNEKMKYNENNEK
jgi:hypothetical protein